MRLEQCLSRFSTGLMKPQAVRVAGNHELWAARGDSYAIFTEELPRRVRAMGWHWLETEPFVSGDVAIVGSVGWYDYSFAQIDLGIPRRFYESKVSPRAAERLKQFAGLLEAADDVPPAAREIVAQWNDGQYVRLGRSDEAFLGELLNRLRLALESTRAARHVVAAIHHLPFRELVPPPHTFYHGGFRQGVSRQRAHRRIAAGIPQRAPRALRP